MPVFGKYVINSNTSTLGTAANSSLAGLANCHQLQQQQQQQSSTNISSPTSSMSSHSSSILNMCSKSSSSNNNNDLLTSRKLISNPIKSTASNISSFNNHQTKANASLINGSNNESSNDSFNNSNSSNSYNYKNFRLLNNQNTENNHFTKNNINNNQSSKTFNSSKHNNSNNNFSGFSTSSSRHQQHQQQKHYFNKTMPNNLINNHQSNSMSNKTSDHFLNNLLHTTSSKSGKISKRKLDKNSTKKINNSGLLQCFNLAEKEKFRQLIAQNCLPFKYHASSQANSTNNSVYNKNLYQNLIHSSPTKIRDDNTFDTKLQQQQLNKGEILTEKVNIPVSSLSIPNTIISPAKVSVGYTRRISLSLDSKLEPFRSNSNLNKYSSAILKNANKSIIEIDVLPSNSSSQSTTNQTKQATKRHNSQIQQIDENDDRSLIILNSNSNSNQTISNIEKFKKETKDYYAMYHNYSNQMTTAALAAATSNNVPVVSSNHKANRSLNELEKNWNESLNKNQQILETILKKSQMKSNALLLEEERYKLKKRQRLEKDKTERELALKFSQQLQLDANKLSSIYIREEEVEIEDEFPELQEDHEKLIDEALVNYPQDQVLVNAFNINITRKDIQTLRGLNWLNDEIINFYMNLICERSQSQSTNVDCDLKVYAFSTFFYPKLLKDGFSSLKRWTRKIDVFSYNVILVPVHLGLHWTLAVVDFNCREIRYYDSMNGNNNECLKALRNYLRDEHMDKKSGAQFDLSNWNCIHVKDVPQQMNGSDCGMFTCKYAEFVSRGKTVFNFNQVHTPQQVIPKV